MNTRRFIASMAFGAISLPIATGATGAGTTPDPLGFVDHHDLTELSLEELMDIEVTIATRSAEPMSKIPAAAYVLTGDEIRRSGHTSIAEALRMVPGFHVSRWMTASWDVTSRGFGPGLSLVNSAYLNQLLVMIDGVVVYTPLFPGVWWPLQDYPLENIERIEVVRGSAGILWGTNAVHGVVNIITKKAEDTQGAMASLRYGRDERHGTVRYGGQIGEDTYYNAWIKGAEYDTLHNPYQDPFNNDWGIVSAGTRFDFKAFEQDFSTWARVYTGGFNTMGYDLDTYDPIQVRDERDGAQIYAAMTDPDVGSKWQAWFTSDQQDLKTVADIHIDEFDIEYQHPLEIGDAHELNLGAGYRWTHSRTYGDDPFWYTFDPENFTRHIFRIFAVDTIALTSLNSSLTLARIIHEHAHQTSQPAGFAGLSAPDGTLRTPASSTTCSRSSPGPAPPKHRQGPSCCVWSTSS